MDRPAIIDIAAKRPRRRFFAALAAAAVSLLAWMVTGALADEPMTPARYGLELPPTFVPLPVVAGKASEAALPKLRKNMAITSHAWGDPADGCYLLTGELAARKIDTIALHEQLRDAAAGAGLDISAWREPRTNGGTSHSSFAFVAPTMQGTVHTIATAPEPSLVVAAMAACFYNDREPERCKQQCKHLLAQFRGPT